MGLYDLTFYDLIKRNAVTFNNQLCWQEVDDDRKLSFAEYKTEIDKLAVGLLKAGITKGDRLGVVGKNSLEFFLVYGAAACIGAIVLPINWRLSADEMCLEFQETLQNKQNELPSISGLYNLKGNSGSFLDFKSLMSVGGEVSPADVCSQDGLVIIHTAAVAGRPRGALLSHSNMLLANLHFNYYLEMTSADVHLNLLPLFHVAGLFLATSAFQAGALNG